MNYDDVPYAIKVIGMILLFRAIWTADLEYMEEYY